MDQFLFDSDFVGQIRKRMKKILWVNISKMKDDDGMNDDDEFGERMSVGDEG